MLFEKKPLYELYGCRKCEKKCIFRSNISPAPVEEVDTGFLKKDKLSVVFGKPTYGCNSSTF